LFYNLQRRGLLSQGEHHGKIEDGKVKQLCAIYPLENMAVEVYGVWNNFKAIRPDDYDNSELFVVNSTGIAIGSMPYDGHIPSEDEALQHIREHTVPPMV